MAKAQPINVCVISAVLLAGCASTSIRYLDAEEFVENAKGIEQMDSVMFLTYVGASRGRAYLEYQDVLTLSGKPRTVVFWTELDGLPGGLAERLRAGSPPWTPWHERSAQGVAQPAGAAPSARDAAQP